MKTRYLIAFVMAFLPLTIAVAQDDLYYKPKKQEKTVVTKPVVDEYVPKGIDMTVDEYNRRNLKSSYQVIGTDSVGNDIIEFTVGDGTYPEKDTLRIDDKFFDDENDFTYTSRLGRYDGFYGWYDPFYSRFWGWGPYSYWGPYGFWGPSYWYSNSYWWPSSWYWDFYYGWGDPWFYSYYHPYSYWGYWGYPYYSGYGYWYHGGGSYLADRNNPSRYHGTASGRPAGVGGGSHGHGYTTASNGTFGGRTISKASANSYYNSSTGRTTYSSGSRAGFGGNRSSSSYSSSSYGSSSPSYSSGSSRSSSPSYSSGSSSSRSSGGSFGGGGSRSGGGFSGGGSGRSSGGGGGGFGGRR